jgi:long-chain acyl-CoA synthetase
MSTEAKIDTAAGAAAEPTPAAVPDDPNPNGARPGLRVAAAPEGTTVKPIAGTVPELFQQQVAARGGGPAMHFKAAGRWQPITWEQYGQAVRRIASYLLGEGVRHGDRVAVLSYNRPEWHIADVATLHVGGTSVGIYLTNSPAQCQYILEHAEAPVVFVENRDQLKKILEVKDRLPKLRRIVLISGALEAGDGDLVTTWEKALRAGEAYSQTNGSEFERRWRAVTPEDMATFIYTSGTTGPPKAVMLDHANLLFTAASSISYLPTLTEDEVSISYLPLAHIAERLAGHVLHVYNGHKLYFAESVSALAATVGELRPTVMFGVPRVWEKFQQAVEKKINSSTGVQGALSRWALGVGLRTAVARADEKSDGGLQYRIADRLVLGKVRALLGFDRVKFLATGAAPISRGTLEFFWALGLPLYEVYGQSEDCGPTSTCRPGQSELGTVGPPIPGVEVRIADDGEVLVKGGNVFRGYFKDEQTTAETLDVDKYLHSGDVGELDKRGFLRITDRKKDLIITAGGKNISPSNLELALKQQPFVGHVVAIGDRRPFMSALITIDAEQVKALAAEVGEPAEMSSLTKSEKVHALFQQGVDAVNKNLSHVEAIKKFAILPADLSVDGGELTPTLKVKRKVVNEKYADVIESIYAGKGGD